MPLYEYRCQDCAAQFERIEKPSSPRDGECPECGGIAHRILGAPALQFKGSGWYVNDYGKGNGSSPSETAASTTESPATPAGAKKNERASDTKTDSKVA